MNWARRIGDFWFTHNSIRTSNFFASLKINLVTAKNMTHISRHILGVNRVFGNLTWRLLMIERCFWMRPFPVEATNRGTIEAV
jgi:hypothetical protein